MNHELFRQQAGNIYRAVGELERMFPGRPFTPDGHMVGSIGECLVADAYDLESMPPSNTGFDALSREGRKIEIKATQSSRVAFRSCPEHTIVIKIEKDGSFSECYNGPGRVIWDTCAGKKRPSNGQFQVSLQRIRMLSAGIADEEKVPRIA